MLSDELPALGKGAADNRVERSLYKRAVGFERDVVKVFLPKDAESPVYARYRESVPPDPTSMIFWLKNRRRNEWRDKQETELSGSVGLQLIHSVPMPDYEKKGDLLERDKDDAGIQRTYTQEPLAGINDRFD